MAIHIGKIIHSLIKNKGLRAKSVAKGIHVSESSIYKIYKRGTIDIDKIIALSQFLNTNLFEPYMEQEPLKSMFNQKVDTLNNEIQSLKALISQRDNRIKELEEIISSQKKLIAIMEKQSSIMQKLSKK